MILVQLKSPSLNIEVDIHTIIDFEIVLEDLIIVLGDYFIITTDFLQLIKELDYEE